MPGRNCAFFGCETSQKHGLSLFKIPSLRHDSEHTVALKTKAREEWLRLILRTREKTPALKKRIEANNIFAVCELYFKPDCILTNKFMFILARRILKSIIFINNTKARYINIHELNVVFSHNI